MSHRSRSQQTLNEVYELGRIRAHDRKLNGGFVHRPADKLMQSSRPEQSSELLAPDRHIGAGQYGDAGAIGYGLYESESDEEPKIRKAKKGVKKLLDKQFSEVTKKHKNRHNIVRKVMQEQGLSMINASKYVKEHNLY